MNGAEHFVWDLDTILAAPVNPRLPVMHALQMLERDIAKTLDHGSGAPPTRIEISYAGETDEIHGKSERFALSFEAAAEEADPRISRAGPRCLRLVGSDDMGLVYGILHLSRTALGVDPFWFWMDREPARIGSAVLPARPFASSPFFVRYRGWFVNDEDFIIGWTDAYPPPREAWFPVFEALLRLGGNMVIPGTDLPRGGDGERLAAEMGLYITHHHAEPLGAEMFSRAYPGLEPRYDGNQALFGKLWSAAIVRGENRKTVWGLGFRGQGDCPFWEQDPAYDTAEKRGALLGSVISRQRDLVRSLAGDAPCCVYIYGELTELYRGGYVKIPEDVIRIWADNGYGKMVSRRQGNVNSRLPSLPAPDDAGQHGIYYHVAFHDLQASNHLTMFQNDPSLIRDELTAAFSRGAKEFLIVNGSNVRHQTYALDLAASLWRAGDADVVSHRSAFVSRFFASGAAGAERLLSAWPGATLRYGPNADDRAGDEYFHHCPRSLIACWMRGEADRPDADMAWAAGNVPLGGQFALFRERLEQTLPGLTDMESEAERAACGMSEEDGDRFRSFFSFQARQLRMGCAGFLGVCRAWDYFAEKDYPRAFISATAAHREYRAASRLLAEAQKGRWKKFYRFDYLANVEATVYAVDSLRRWIRQFGDAPDYFRWSRAYAVDRRERGVYLENTTRRVLGDDELAEALAAAFNEPS